MNHLAQLRYALPLGIAVFAVAITALSYWNSSQELLSEITQSSVREVQAFVTRFGAILEAHPWRSSAEWKKARIASLGAGPNTVLALATNPDGEIIASTRTELIGKRLSDVSSLGLPDAAVKTAVPQRSDVAVVADPDTRRITGYIPICESSQTSGAVERCGTFIYQESLALAYGSAVAALKRHSIRESAGVGLLAVLLWLGIHHRVTRRVDRLITTANGFAAGAREWRSRIPGRDEIAQVSRAFDAVLDTIIRDEEALRAHGQSMKRLAQTIQGLARARDLTDIARGVCAAAGELLKADSTTFVLREGEECVHFEEHSLTRVWKGQRYSMTQCVAGWSMLQGDQVVVPDVYDDPRIDPEIYRAVSIKSLAVTPVGMEAPVAAIGVYWRSQRTPTAQQLEVLRALSDATAVAMRNVSMYEELERRVKQRTAEAERAAAYKSRLLAMASHDLRQPLQTARLLNATLRRQLTGAETQEILRRESLALMAMADLTGTLLNVAKLDSGSLQPQPVIFELPELLSEIYGEFSELAREKGVELQVQSCGVHLRTDRTLLRQIVQNLVANALKYTDRGQISIQCSEQDERVAIEVRDTGIGIAPDKLESIFEEFYQVRSMADGSGGRGGLGLGLSIVRRLAALLDLKVEVRSTPGVGTTFVVNAPVVKSVPAPVAPVATARSAPTGKRHLILLVEDDEAVRTATAMFLRIDSFDVEQASGLEELRERLSEPRGRSPSLVISDYHLGSDELGSDAIALVRARFGADFPAIVLTGDTSRLTSVLQKDERTRVLNKPVDVEKLSETIRSLI